MIDHDDLNGSSDDFRYKIFSSATGGDDVLLWCETDTLAEAEETFELLSTKPELGHIALMDDHARIVLRQAGKIRTH